MEGMKWNDSKIIFSVVIFDDIYKKITESSCEENCCLGDFGEALKIILVQLPRRK